MSRKKVDLERINVKTRETCDADLWIIDGFDPLSDDELHDFFPDEECKKLTQRGIHILFFDRIYGCPNVIVEEKEGNRQVITCASGIFFTLDVEKSNKFGRISWEPTPEREDSYNEYIEQFRKHTTVLDTQGKRKRREIVAS